MDHLKPLQKPRTMPVFQRIDGVALTLAADELLLKNAAVVSEGQVETDKDGAHVYYGTTFISIDLKRKDLHLGIDQKDFGLLIEAARRSILFRVRLMRLVRLETERRSFPLLLRGMLVQTEFKIEDRQFLVDINIECPLAMPLDEADGHHEDQV